MVYLSLPLLYPVISDFASDYRLVAKNRVPLILTFISSNNMRNQHQ